MYCLSSTRANTPAPQIIDLESRLAQALQDSAGAVANPASLNQRSNPDWLPTVTPPKLTLTGHRANVNAVTFHPRYSVLVSASDDSTMKVWDWETGDLERTIQGHTRRVSDCDYDSKGKYLGKSSSRFLGRTLLARLNMLPSQFHVPMTYSSSCGMLKTNTRTFPHSEDMSTPSRLFAFSPETIASSAQAAITLSVSGRWRLRSCILYIVLFCLLTPPSTRHCIKVIKPHEDWIRAAISSPDGRFLVTSCMDHVRSSSLFGAVR